MDRAYEDDKSLALTKAHDFYTVVPPKKKIVNPLGYMINNFINNKILSNNISLD